MLTASRSPSTTNQLFGERPAFWPSAPATSLPVRHVGEVTNSKAQQAALTAIRSRRTGDLDSLLIKSRSQLDLAELLMTAVRHGYSEQVRAILSAGGAAHVECVDEFGFTPLATATKNALSSVFDALLTVCDVNNGSGRFTALEVACRQGLTMFVRKLVRAGAKLTPYALHLAVQHKECAGVVEILLAHGADVNAEVDGRTPLDWCVLKRRAAPIALLKGVRVEQRHLLTAVKSEHAATVSALLDKGAALDLDEALASSRSAGVTTVLLQRGADVNRRRTDDFTHLFAAAESGDFDFVAVLLKHGANVNARQYDGATALSVAVEHGRQHMAELLLMHNADASLCRDGVPLLTRATSCCLIAKLAKAGAPVNVWMRDGGTPLQCAVARQDVAAAEQLMRLGADAECGALTAAFQSGAWTSPADMLRLIGRLIRAGASVNEGAPLEALLRAKQPTHSSALDLLLFAGANVPRALYAEHQLPALLVNMPPSADEARSVALARSSMRARRLSELRKRVVDIVVALRDLSALELICIVDADRPLVQDMPFHLKWQLVTFAKHFVARAGVVVERTSPNLSLIEFCRRHINNASVSPW